MFRPGKENKEAKAREVQAHRRPERSGAAEEKTTQDHAEAGEAVMAAAANKGEQEKLIVSVAEAEDVRFATEEEAKVAATKWKEDGAAAGAAVVTTAAITQGAAQERKEEDSKRPEMKAHVASEVAAVAAANHSQGAHATTRSTTTRSPTTTSFAAELARRPPEEIPEIWMLIAPFLSIPSLGRLACTASCFRAVLCTCVSASAAQALNVVCIYA